MKGKSEARREKLERLARYRDYFDHARASSPLAFGRPSTDKRGANESEIGILFFDDAPNSVENVLLHFPAVHRRFMERLRERGHRLRPVNRTATH